MRFLLSFAPAMLLTGAAFAADLPNPALTPGDALTAVPTAKAATCLSKLTGQEVSKGDPVTQEMVCTSGYTKCVRAVAPPVRASAFHGYGLQGNHTGYCEGQEGCELDHLVSLEIGGSNSVKNLWPQSFDTSPWNAHVKDQLENFFHAEVCAGRIPLEQAQKEISSNWIDAYRKYLGEPR